MSDNKNITVKEEKPAGGPAFKPKFVPKAPVKRDPVPEPPKPEPKEEKSQRGDRKDGGRGGNGRDGGRDKGGRGGGRGGGEGRGRGEGGRGGRGHFVMPTGPAFFTGNAKSTLAAKAAMPSITIGGGGGGSGGGSSSGGIPSVKSEQQRIARPNEVIDDIATMDAAAAAALLKAKSSKPGSSDSSASSYYYQDDSDDSDVSRDEDGKRRRDREQEDQDEAFLYEDKRGNGVVPVVEGLEVWPPKKYDPTAPLSLPFGPKTVTMRRLLANAPILADPNDPTALINEENQSLFLVQLPSDLRMESLTRTVDENNNEETTPGGKGNSSRSTAPILGSDRKLGKLQLYKSGKVKLVTENGNSYDVNPGIVACFMQCLMSVEVPSAEEDAAYLGIKSEPSTTAASSSSSAAAAAKKAAAAAAATAGPDGKLCFLGNITRKLVITPNYELGTRRSSSAAMKATTSSNNLVIGVDENVDATTPGGMSTATMDVEEDEVGGDDGGGDEYVDYE